MRLMPAIPFCLRFLADPGQVPSGEKCVCIYIAYMYTVCLYACMHVCIYACRYVCIKREVVPGSYSWAECLFQALCKRLNKISCDDLLVFLPSKNCAKPTSRFMKEEVFGAEERGVIAWAAVKSCLVSRICLSFVNEIEGEVLARGSASCDLQKV